MFFKALCHNKSCQLQRKAVLGKRQHIPGSAADLDDEVNGKKDEDYDEDSFSAFQQS